MSNSIENVNDCVSRLYKIKAHQAASIECPDGRLWIAEIHCGKSLCELKVSPTDTQAAPQETLTKRAGAIADCILSYNEKNQPLAVWRQIDSTRSQIHYAIFADDHWIDGGAIPAPPGQFAYPAVCRDVCGRPWLAMQSTASGSRHIFVSWLTGGQWSFAQRISDGDGNSFAPAMCQFGQGVRIVWDGHFDGEYGIFMRELDCSARLASREDQAIVSTSKTLLANASIAAIDNETSIIVWEKAQKNWGHRNLVYRGSRDEMSEGNFLMARRDLHSAVISPSGIAKTTGKMNELFDEECQSPVRTGAKIACGADSSLWLSFRQIVDLSNAQRHQGFCQMLTNYRDGKWSAPIILPDSEGDCDMAASLSNNADGTLAVNYSGRKKQDYYSMAAAIPQTGAAGPIKSAAKPKTMKVPDFDNAQAREITWLNHAYGSKRLLWGDIHRHTSLSGCRWWCEGSARDAYRYAIESAKLDFMALTDHTWDLTSEDTRHDLFDSANTFNTPGVFTAFCAYELSLTEGQGHMVVISEDDNPQIPSAKTRKGLYRSLARSGAIVIPHHMGDPTYPYKWGGHDDSISPLAEIYQPYRTSFEQSDAPTPPTAWIDEGNAPLDEGMLVNAWRSGLKIGVVASSDHLSTGGAYVGLWAKGNTRREVLDALKQRCCYGATDRIELRFSADGNIMGSVFTAESSKVNFEVQCKCPDKIQCVELLAGGEVIKSFRPVKSSPKKLAVAHSVKLTGKSEEFYYVRVIQKNRQMAWSSPIWITASTK